MGQKFRKKFNFIKLILSSLFMCLFLVGCSTSPPKNMGNICDIFFEKREWFDAAQDMKEKWGVPIHVPMAMMYQESSFKAKALPPKDYVFFGLIPWGRVSSAYGYSQAKTPTWADYKRETDNSWADRTDFDDALDFMGWFITKTHKINGISKWDAELQYLNYHEGWGGYRRGTQHKKAWLKKVAKVVKSRSLVYATQLKGCEKELSKGWFWRLFS
ncbi:transglycosylase SLT domain-containing protein [Paraglaciecola aestuariivivens]